MKRTIEARPACRLAAAFATCACILALGLAACAPQQGQQADTGSQDNDTAVKGEYVPFDPEAAAEAAAASGRAIEGSDEEELQQERIAGGAVGAVTSKKLEKLSGITDGSEGEYAPSFGIYGQPPAMGHGDNGSDCLSCHEDGGAGAQQPPNHASANLANEDCAGCHATKK